MTDRLPALRREAIKKRLSDSYESYRANPSRHESVFYTEVLNFARMKLYNLEFEFKTLGTSGTVDDYAQDIAIGVWAGLKSFQGDGEAFYGWLHKICFNKKQDFSRELVEQQRDKVGLTIIVEGDDGFSEVDNPEVYESRHTEIMVTIPASVQGTDLNICKLIMDGMNYGQIADALKMSEQAIKSRLHKLRTRIAEERAMKNSHYAVARQKR